MSQLAAQKVLCVLYADPASGFPPNYARGGIPHLTHYPDGQPLPTPTAIDFTAGHLLGSVSGGLGLERFLTEWGCRFVVTSDKDGPDSVFERELADADVVISQPFWPGYLTAERIEKAPRLKLAITAGIGSDHVDLQSAIDRNITVCEVTWCNSVSVAEHAVMQILALVRDYIPQYGWVVRGRLEHRRRRFQVIRYRGNGRGRGGGGKDRPRSPETDEALRRQAPLHRQASACPRARAGVGPDVP